MNRKPTFVISALALSLLALNASAIDLAPHARTMVSGIDKASQDPGVRSQDDFHRHVSGTWLNTTAIPADQAEWGGIVTLEQAVSQQLATIILSLGNHPESVPGSDAQKISDLYASFMDAGRIEALGMRPLEPLFAQIGALSDKQQLPQLMAQFNRLGIIGPYNYQVRQDSRNSTRYIVELQQAGLGMVRDYYLNSDAKFATYRAEYLKHVETMLQMAGDGDAANSAKAILQLESALAKVQWSRAQSKDVLKAYNKIGLNALHGLMPEHDLLAFLKQAGIAAKVEEVIVVQPSYFTALAQIMQETPLPGWQAYLRWRVLSAHASQLPAKYADQQFAFYETTLQGITQQEAREKRGVQVVDMYMGEALGRLYVARHFSPEHKLRMEKMVGNLMLATRKSLESLNWMDASTKKAALTKLAGMHGKIGYPNKWRDYSALLIRKDDLIGNVMRANQFAKQTELNKLGQPIDRDEWQMKPQTVNAYHNRQMNEIVFPAAILQKPFFDPDADDAVNYGAIGAFIGHEISHAFDDQGARFDENGNLRNWWSPADHAKFAAKAAALVKQYSAYSPMPGQYVDGKLTLSENLADNAGLAAAFQAYKLSLHGKTAAVLDGLSGEQRFYTGWAQMWQVKKREAAMLRDLKADTHALEQFRVNGVLVNQDHFYKAFKVRPGDKMYLPPQQRVKIW